MIKQTDISRQLFSYLPFVSTDFEVSEQAISCVTSEDLYGNTLFTVVVEDTSQFTVGLHYHLAGAYFVNPILSNTVLDGESVKLTFEREHNCFGLKTIQLENTEYKVAEFIDGNSLVVFTQVPITEIAQHWALNSETAWVELVSINGNGLVFKSGIGRAEVGEVLLDRVVISQHVYIAPTADSVIELYSQTLPIAKKACYIVFGDRQTLTPERAKAGESTRNTGKTVEDYTVTTEIDLFVVWPNNPNDERHVNAVIDAYSKTYSTLSACLFGFIGYNGGRQITPTTSNGGVIQLDKANYIHRYGFQAIDFINIIENGLYYNKLQDDEVTRETISNLRFKTVGDGQLSDVLAVNFKT